jgi:hypothetical protein
MASTMAAPATPPAMAPVGWPDAVLVTLAPAGDAVGASVGARVGEGASVVGAAVGTTVGVCETVGAAVGASVALAVGLVLLDFNTTVPRIAPSAPSTNRTTQTQNALGRFMVRYTCNGTRDSQLT